MVICQKRILLWKKYIRLQERPTTTFSLFNLAQTHVFSWPNFCFNQIAPLCSLPSHISLRPQWKKRPGHHVFGKPTSVSFHLSKASYSSVKETDNQQENLLSQMNIRLVNENSFLSWCRNAYLSSVVGVAMITEGTTVLAQSAGVGALVVGTMNLFWGTGCHITNLIKLRHVSGMSGFTLTLNILGSSLHSLLWLFVLICYIGFLDETRAFASHSNVEKNATVLDFQQFDHRGK